MAKSFEWTTKNVGITVGGVVAALLILPNLGNGLQVAARTVGAVDTAYAAKEQAEEVDDRFNEYLTKQEAYTEALQGYVEQQQRMMPMQQQAPNQSYIPEREAPIRDYDKYGNEWCCWEESKGACWGKDAWVRCE